jgi:MFS family permease
MESDSNHSKSLKVARKEIVSSSIANGLTEPFMMPYALALGATPFHVGLLGSIRNLMLSLVQLKSADAVYRVGSRKKLVLWTVGLQALLFLPLALVGPLFGHWAVAVMIALYTLASASSSFGGPAWGSLISQYLQAGERGHFFGLLGRASGLCTTLAGLGGGLLLFLFSDAPLIGFGLLCVSALLARFNSWRWLNRFEELPLEHRVEHKLSFAAFVRRFPHDNFVRFAVYFGLVNFVVHIGSPFLPVYMLKELRFDYLTYSVVIFSAAATGFTVVRSWGLIGDIFGNQAVLRWMIMADAMLPLFWAISPHPAPLIVLQVLGGAFWAGINLSAVNFVYDSVPPASRTRYLAYFNAINGCCMSAGTFLGGWLLAKLPPLAGSAFVTLFLLSSGLRLFAGLMFRRGVREVRPIRQIGLREVVFDMTLQSVLQVLGSLSVRPEEEFAEPPRGFIQKFRQWAAQLL